MRVSTLDAKDRRSDNLAASRTAHSSNTSGDLGSRWRPKCVVPKANHEDPPECGPVSPVKQWHREAITIRNYAPRV